LKPKTRGEKAVTEVRTLSNSFREEILSKPTERGLVCFGQGANLGDEKKEGWQVADAEGSHEAERKPRPVLLLRP